MQELKKSGPPPYPHKFQVTHTLSQFISKFNGLGAGEDREDDTVCLAGK